MIATEENLSLMPDSIHFGHVIYTIHTDPKEIEGADREVDTDSDVGGSFHTTRQIWVRTNDIALEQVQNTLLHEVLHVCLNVAGVQYALEVLAKNANVEEAYVSSLTTPLHGVLAQNPDLIEFLQR